MRKLIALSGAAALGVGMQSAAYAYNATANVTMTWGGNAAINDSTDVLWTSSGPPNTLNAMTNTTYFTTKSGYNGFGYYNPDFQDVTSCTTWATGNGFTYSLARKYSCRYLTAYGAQAYSNTNSTPAVPITDASNRAAASGTIFVSDTTLTGTLTILATTDEPTGGTTTVLSGGFLDPDANTGTNNSVFAGTVNIGNSIGNGFTGYNYAAANGSPFGNAWYGINAGEAAITLNLTGAFSASSWSITGGTVKYSSATFACQQGVLPAPGTLCTPSYTMGIFDRFGEQLSFGGDPDGVATGSSVSMITVKDTAGISTLATLSGVLASLSVSGGNLTTNSGEFRRVVGSASGGCLDHIRWDGTKIACGQLTVGLWMMAGTVTEVPVPAAAWLIAPAVLAAGRFARRRRKI
jgi:hypothetical protein